MQAVGVLGASQGGSSARASVAVPDWLSNCSASRRGTLKSWVCMGGRYPAKAFSGSTEQTGNQVDYKRKRDDGPIASGARSPTPADCRSAGEFSQASRLPMRQKLRSTMPGTPHGPAAPSGRPDRRCRGTLVLRPAPGSPSTTFTALSHPPDLGRLLSHCGNAANSVNGMGKCQREDQHSQNRFGKLPTGRFHQHTTDNGARARE